MSRRLLVLLLPDHFFMADVRLTCSAKRLLARLAVASGFFLLGCTAIALLLRTNVRDVLAGALLAWSVSGIIWAVTSHRSGNESALEGLRELAERDLLHARINQLCDRLGAPLLNLNAGDLAAAVAVRLDRHAHLGGLEEFGDYAGAPQVTDNFWDEVACGYSRPQRRDQ
jgi:hypothetical protein